MSAPAPLTVKEPPDCMELPATPTVPTSASVQVPPPLPGGGLLQARAVPPRPLGAPAVLVSTSLSILRPSCLTLTLRVCGPAVMLIAAAPTWAQPQAPTGAVNCRSALPSRLTQLPVDEASRPLARA